MYINIKAVTLKAAIDMSDKKSNWKRRMEHMDSRDSHLCCGLILVRLCENIHYVKSGSFARFTIFTGNQSWKFPLLSEQKDFSLEKIKIFFQQSCARFFISSWALKNQGNWVLLKHQFFCSKYSLTHVYVFMCKK